MKKIFLITVFIFTFGIFAGGQDKYAALLDTLCKNEMEKQTELANRINNAKGMRRGAARLEEQRHFRSTEYKIFEYKVAAIYITAKGRGDLLEKLTLEEFLTLPTSDAHHYISISTCKNCTKRELISCFENLARSYFRLYQCKNCENVSKETVESAKATKKWIVGCIDSIEDLVKDIDNIEAEEEWTSKNQDYLKEQINLISKI